MSSPRPTRWGSAFSAVVQDKGAASPRLLRWGNAFFGLVTLTPWLCCAMIAARTTITSASAASLTRIEIITGLFLLLAALCDGSGVAFIVWGRTHASRRLFWQGVWGLSIGLILTGLALTVYLLPDVLAGWSGRA